MTISWLQSWIKTHLQNHLMLLQKTSTCISMKILWDKQELLQGVELISFETVLCKNSRSSEIQQMQRKSLRVNIFSLGTRSARFSSQCCTTLPPLYFHDLPLKMKMRGGSPLQGYISDRHTRLSVDMISSLLFINRNSRVIPPEKYIDIFEGST